MKSSGRRVGRKCKEGVEEEWLGVAQNAFYAPTQELRWGVQEVWAVWTARLLLVQSAMREHALGAVSKLQ